MSEGSLTPKKGRGDLEDLESFSKEELIARIREQDAYVKQLESKRPRFDRGEDEVDPSFEERLKQQQRDFTKRENTLVHRLTTKEQELQDYMNQIQEMKQAQTQGTTQLRSMLLDPAVNIVFQRMGKELDESQEKLKQTQNELSAWKFTPDSQTGKQLMTKCRMLLQENEDLGKQIASGRTAKLEGEIALQKTLVSEMKENQAELDEFLGDLEEDTEGMQSMIYVLQQQLRETKEQLSALQEENSKLKARATDNLGGTNNLPIDDSHSTPAVTSNSSIVQHESHVSRGEAEEQEKYNAVKEEKVHDMYSEDQFSNEETESSSRNNFEDYSQHSHHLQTENPSHCIKEEPLGTDSAMEVDHSGKITTKYQEDDLNYKYRGHSPELQPMKEEVEVEEIENKYKSTHTVLPSNEDIEHEAMDTEQGHHSSPHREHSPSRTQTHGVDGDQCGEYNGGRSPPLDRTEEQTTDRTDTRTSKDPSKTGWESQVDTNGECADNGLGYKSSPEPVCPSPVSKDITSMVERDEKEEVLQNGVGRTSTVDDIEDL